MKWKGVAVWIALSCLMVPQGWADPLFLRATKQIDYQTALDDLFLAMNNHGYTSTKVQPVDQGLRAKGYEAPDYNLIFFGEKEQVDQVLAVNPEAAILLPLKIVLYREGDVVIAIAPSMEMWKGIFGGEALNFMIDKWQKDVLSILHEFSRQ